MAVGTRLKGNSGFYLTFKIGAGAATVLGDDVKEWELEPEAKDSKDITFAEASGALAADWTLTLTAIVSFSTGSLWNYLWTNPNTDVTVVLAPYGNSTATATQPQFTGTFNTGLLPGISNSAGVAGDTEGAEFEQELICTAGLTKLVA